MAPQKLDQCHTAAVGEKRREPFRKTGVHHVNRILVPPLCSQYSRPHLQARIVAPFFSSWCSPRLRKGSRASRKCLLQLTAFSLAGPARRLCGGLHPAATHPQPSLWPIATWSFLVPAATNGPATFQCAHHPSWRKAQWSRWCFQRVSTRCFALAALHRSHIQYAPNHSLVLSSASFVHFLAYGGPMAHGNFGAHIFFNFTRRRPKERQADTILTSRCALEELMRKRRRRAPAPRHQHPPAPAHVRTCTCTLTWLQKTQVCTCLSLCTPTRAPPCYAVQRGTRCTCCTSSLLR